MLSVHRLPHFGAVALLTTLAACGGVSSPSTNTSSEFRGTLEVGGRSTHTFRVSKNGEYEVRIVELAPSSSALIGVIVGRESGGVCFTEGNNPFGQLNRLALNGFAFSGTYCVTLYDPGSLNERQTYLVRVSHP
jgi:hypothetical protein